MRIDRVETKQWIVLAAEEPVQLEVRSLCNGARCVLE